LKGFSLPYLGLTCPTWAGLRRGKNAVHRTLADTEALGDLDLAGPSLASLRI
jgi:hypothetical protein